jgi:hypothetical protein
MAAAKPKKRSFRTRPVSRDTAHHRIRTLVCFHEVYDKILDGWPLTEVARFIQDVKKEATDITRVGLVAALQDYRNTIPPAELTKKRLTSTYMDAVKEVEEGLDELQELEKLYKMQMGRITIDVQNEKNIKKLLPTTGQELRIAREILSTYADLKMDLGLSKRHLGQMDVEARILADVAVRYNKPEVQNVLANPQSRKKVLSLVERLMSRSASSLASEESVAPEVVDVSGEETPAPEHVVEGNLLGEDEVDPLAPPIPMSEEESA